MPAGIILLALALSPLPALATSISLSGTMPAEVERARAAGLFAIPDRAPGAARRDLKKQSAISLTEGVWHVPVLLVSFSDHLNAYPAPRFQTLLFDTLGANPDGSFSDYYYTVSRGKLRIVGDVFGWFQLPNPQWYYAYGAYGLNRVGFPMNDAGMVTQAVEAADPTVDFSRYDRDGDGMVDEVIVVHVGYGGEVAAGDKNNFWSCTSALSVGWDNSVPYTTHDLRQGSSSQYMKVDRFSVLPELSSAHADSMADIGVYCHEFGHVLGWPDLYDATVLGGGLNNGPGNWCLMASGAFGGDSRHPELPTRPCAWALLDAGWIPLENITTSGPMVVPPVADPDGRVYRLWWQGEASPEYFLFENRPRQGYDADQPAGGVLVYRIQDDVIASRRGSNTVNSGSMPGVRVEEADGRFDLLHGSRGDDSDPFPGALARTRFADDTQPTTRSYLGRYTNLVLSDIRPDGDRMRLWAQVDPASWMAPERATVAQRLLFDPSRPAVRLGPHLHLVGVNATDSSRVYALQRPYELGWSAPERVSSAAGATEPAWADPGLGPLTAVWSDRRYGNPEVSYRLWGDPPGEERRATFSPGYADHPAAAWLADGEIAMAWLDTRDGRSQIYFKRFFPGGEAAAAETRVTDLSLTGEVLSFAMARTPRNYLLVAYSGRNPGVDEVYYQRFQPDSGWAAPFRLSQYDGYPSGTPGIVILPSGNIRFLWRDTTPTRTTVESLLIDGYGFTPLPAPPTVFTSLFSLASVRVAQGAAPDMSAIIARASEPPADRVLVGLQHADGIWDYGMGWISQGLDAGGSMVTLDLDEGGALSALWAVPGAASTDLWTRRYVGPTVAPVAVGGLPPAAAPRVRALPNPAHGQVRFEWSAPATGGSLCVYSAAGRRVARLPARAGRAAWTGVSEDGTPRASGVYFYRLEDPLGRALSATGKLVWLR